jgi:hypothetical protein
VLRREKKHLVIKLIPKLHAEYFLRSNHQPLEARKNQNKLLLEEDALIFLLQNEHMSTSSNFTWLHVDLQRVKVRSIALTVAFSEQMCQVASTGQKRRQYAHDQYDA